MYVHTQTTHLVDLDKIYQMVWRVSPLRISQIIFKKFAIIPFRCLSWSRLGRTCEEMQESIHLSSTHWHERVNLSILHTFFSQREMPAPRANLVWRSHTHEREARGSGIKLNLNLYRAAGFLQSNQITERLTPFAPCSFDVTNP